MTICITTKQVKKQSKNIGLFGSSFNPPHLGHWAVLKDLAEQDLFDEIWLIPVYSHPFDKELAPFDQRLKMVELLWTDLNRDKIRISTIEKELNKSPSYTYNVVQELKSRYPNYKFTLILGSDAKNEFDKWYRYQDLKQEVDFYFIPRKGFEDSSYPQVSSTEIRENMKKNKSVDELTTNKIAKYLKENKIY